jgi:hypothetical protein
VAKLATTAASSTSTATGGAAPGGGSGSSGGGNQGGEVHSEAAIAGPGGPEAQKKMVAFSQCMRTHGVPDFPEPSEGKLLIRGSKNGLNPGSPQFRTAMKACRSLAPAPKLSPQQTAAMQAQALKFSACMRSHGLPNFPDPKFEGGGVRMSLHAGPGGIDPSSPQFQAAQKACQGDLPFPKGGPGPLRAGPAGP